MTRPSLVLKLALGLMLALIVIAGAYRWQNASVAYAATIPVSTCDESTLDAAISSANANDTVAFNCSGTITLSGTITVTKNLTLDGTGQTVTLSGGNAIEPFVVLTNTNFTLNNLTVANGKSVYGGAIYNYGTLTATNTNFVSNTVYAYGGAIYNYNNNPLTFFGTAFISNTAQSYGGAIYNNGTGDIISQNSNFSSNFSYGGGAIYNNNTNNITATNTNFISNTINSPGGAIYDNKGGNIAFYGSNLNYNSAGAAPGGAIYNSSGNNFSVIISNSTVLSNSTNGPGGVIYDSNISNPGTVTVYSSTVSYNYSGSGGAFIYNNSSTNFNITNSNFISDTANGPGGVIDSSGGGLAIDGSTFTKNSSGVAPGGAIYLFNGSDVTISNSTLNNNFNSGSPGGAIYTGNITGTFAVYSSTLNYNSSGSSSGGAIFTQGDASIIISNSNLISNTANSPGGAIDNGSGNVAIYNSNLNYNSSGNAPGGAIYTYGASFITISNSTLNYNSNSNVGGSVYNGSNLSGNFTVFSSTLSYNKSGSGPGGAIFSNGAANFNVSSSNFISNTGGFGGAIYNNSGNMVISDSTLNSNYSGTAPAGAIFDGGVITITNSTLNSNGNNLQAGAVYTVSGADIYSSTLNYNYAGSGPGGAIFSNGSTVISNSNLISNTAKVSGGAIFANGLATYGSTFSQNYSSSGPGGAIFASGSSLVISNSTFMTNSNTLYGGAIYIGSGSPIIANSTFANNSSNAGGAIVNASSSVGSIANSTFANNFSLNSGGAISNTTQLLITNTTFANNSAGAGNSLASSGIITISNSILSSSGNNCSGTITDSGYNLANDNSCNFSNTSQNNVQNLNLGTLGNYGGATETVPLLAGSKAIGFVATGCPATDQRGYARPATNCAAGSVELAGSTLTLTNAPNSSTYGQPVTFTTTLSPTNATGTVTFTLGTTSVTSSVSSGVATYVTSTLPVGSTVITATYSGDSNYTAATSNMVTQTVNAASSNVTVSSSPNPSSYGQAVTFTATIGVGNSASVVRPHATGDNTVSFVIDGNTVATEVPVTNNTATYVTSTLSVGSHAVTASYTGSPTSNPSTSQVLTQTVTKAIPNVNLASSATVITQGQTISFTAQVTSTVGTPTGTVTFFDGATQLGSAIALTNGTATFSTNSLSVGSHSITAVYSGDANFSTATSNAVTVTVNAANNGGGGSTLYTYYLPFVANNANNFTTYLAFQNIGAASANITATYYDNNGNALSASTLITQVAQYAESLPNNPFANGKQGTGIITSDQPLNVIVPEATPYGGSAYAVNSGSSNSLVAPFALNNAFGDFTTQLNVFNGGASAVTATVTFYGTVGNSTAITSTSTSVNIAAHTTANLNQNTLPSGFSGWAQITGSANTLVAQVLEQSPSTHFVAIANAAANASNSLYASAVFNGGYGGFYTGANIVNPNANAVTVTLTYYDLSGNSTPTTPFSIPAHGVSSVYNGSNSGGNGLPNGGLPKNFIGAVAVSSVGGGIVMSVNENGGLTAAGNSRSGTYAAIANGGSTVGLPVISNGGFTYITGDTIFNTSNQPVTATIGYYDTNGKLVNGASKTFTVGGNSSQAYYQGDGSLPSGFYGTAVITETGGPANSLVVTTNAQNAALFYTYSEPNS